MTLIQGKQIDSTYVPNVARAMLFGSGRDGNTAIAAGTTLLTQDLYADNITITGTGALQPGPYTIYVRDTLDLSSGACASNQHE